MQIGKNTKIGELTTKYPNVKDFLISLSDEYKNLRNEEFFSLMKDIVTIEMIATKGGIDFEELKGQIENFLNK